MKGTFQDRYQAGRLLAQFLKTWSFEKNNTLVLALPRGGVPVAYEVAKTLDCPLDVFFIEKIGHPLHPDYNLGSDGSAVNVKLLNYRKAYPTPTVQGKTVILVDDGISTGITAMVAADSIKAQGAARVILATPACAKRTAIKLKAIFENVACLIEPTKFVSVSNFYQQFSDVSEDDVIDLLTKARAEFKNQLHSESTSQDLTTLSMY